MARRTARQMAQDRLASAESALAKARKRQQRLSADLSAVNTRIVSLERLVEYRRADPVLEEEK